MPRRRRDEPDARAAALSILDRIGREEGHSNALLADLPAGMEARDRALTTELVYGVLRSRNSLDRIVARVSTRPTAGIDPSLLGILRIAVYQITRLSRVPRFAAVDEAVEQARARRGEGAAKFVNGVLRSACRALDSGELRSSPPPPGAPPASTIDYLEETYSCPAFLIRRFLERYGRSETEALLATFNRPAPVVLRATDGQHDQAALIHRLSEEGVVTQPSPWLPEALRVVQGVAQHSTPFREGAIYIQDEASQMVARLIEPLSAGEDFVDLCAAPGGKFLAIAAARSAGSGRMIAADRSRERLNVLRENAGRIGIGDFFSVVMDAAHPALLGCFPRVLLDAACSGTGIIRRHPEIRWRRDEEQIDRLALRQAEHLERACDLVAPGGRLVYSVCSLEPEEGVERVAALLHSRPEMSILDARRLLPPAAASLVESSGCLMTLPHRHDLDGFYAAVLERGR